MLLLRPVAAVVALVALSSITLGAAATRAWYYNNGDGYLGTDTLVSLERARSDSDREP